MSETFAEWQWRFANKNGRNPTAQDAFDALTSAPAEPQPCPRCDGSGEVTVMSDGGPDAYEVPVECPHCHGNQTLEAAYNGVVKLLDRSEDKYRECAAILYLGRADRKASDRITEIAEYITKPGAQMDWARDRLIALADMAKVAAPAEPASLRIDFKQATDLLAMFADEPNEITLTHYPKVEHHFEEGFSISAGLYAHYTDMPEEGSIYLGVSDQEAMPDSPAETPPAAGAIDARDSQIITLCGSARFERLFKAWNEALTMAGHTVFSLTAYPSDKRGVKQWYTEEQKTALDAAHFRKIEASDAIFVLNLHAYIGESTLREIEYARKLGKAVYFLESWGKGYGIGGSHTDEAQRAAEADGLALPTASPIDTTTRSGSKDPWAGRLLGPAGALRSSIVELTKSAALASREEAPAAAGAAQAVADDERFEAFFYGSFRDGGFTVGGHPVSELNARHIWNAALAATPAPEAVDAARWRRLVNASELNFPVAAIADDPENDCLMLYGRTRLEQFIDGMDEVSDQYQDDALKAAQPIEREDGK